MKKLRGAIIGCGSISEFHLRGWSRIPEVQICALVDPDLTRAQERRAQFAPGARIYDGMEAALAGETLDFVDIITPPWLHREQCLLAAKNALHIVCQKPLCDRLDDAHRLIAELRGYPQRFVVHENHRYRPWFREVVRRAHDGFFGRIRYIELIQHDPAEPPEKIDTEVEHGVLLQYGVHLVDMVHALLGDPLRIHARMHRINPRVRGESLAHVIMEYPEATAVVGVSWKSVGVQQGSALVVGESGEASYEGRLTRAETSRFRLCAGNAIVSDEARSPTADYIDSFHEFERRFVDSVCGDSPPPQPAAENLGSLISTFAAYEAARLGEAVSFNALAKSPLPLRPPSAP